MKPQEVELTEREKGKFFNVLIDGKESVEHQIEIHLTDLLSLSRMQNHTVTTDKAVEIQSASQISMLDVFEGLRYVMNYRIRGGRMPHLNPSLCKRLAEILLLFACHRSSGQSKSLKNLLLSRKDELSHPFGISPSADIAFELFAEFIEEVDEFRKAVAEMPPADLKSRLKFDLRISPTVINSDKPNRAIIAVSLLGLLSQSPEIFPQISFWTDLVRAEDVKTVGAAIRKFQGAFNSKKIFPSTATSRLLPPQNLFFDRDASRVADMFKTSIQTGLSSEIVPLLRDHYGANVLPSPPKKTIAKMIFEQLSDFMIIILLCTTIISAAVDHEEPASPVILAIVVVLNVVIGVSQEIKASKAMAALSSLTVSSAKVVRDGVQVNVPSSEIVPGDLLVLEEGDSVPADLRLVSCSQLYIIESILTGESEPTCKNFAAIKGVKARKLPLADYSGNAFMATMVARGRGSGIVVRTGKNSEIGKISSAIASSPEIKTPIQTKLNSLGKLLVIAAVSLCLLFVIIGISWGRDAIGMVRNGIVLAVSVIPEGLVAVVTVSMAISVAKMAKASAIVRKLPSVETLGSVTVVCSDKTGTLTEGKMTVTDLWLSLGCTYKFVENQVELVDTVNSISNPSDHLKLAMFISAVSNNSIPIADLSTSKDVKYNGDPTEVALSVAAEKANFPVRHWLGSDYPLEKVAELSFDSDRKMMSVVLKLESHSKSNSGFILSKGAPEAILAKCLYSVSPSHDTPIKECYLNFAGINVLKLKSIDENELKRIERENVILASKGLRVLALAFKPLNSPEALEFCVDVSQKTLNMSKSNSILVEADENEKGNGSFNIEPPESHLIFIGLIGLIDPPRAGVKEAIIECKNAGIRVCMITGDHISTAISIAKSLSILPEHCDISSLAIRGKELDVLSDDAIAQLNPFPLVFARVSPDNKLAIVRALQKEKNYVAMTGDGVNDAPAIKRADVGIAMGISGTEITKEAADIILADDNFCTIVSAIKEGRRVFDNINKFIVYLLSCNSAEIWTMLIAVTSNLPTPFSPINILWANIIADVPCSMSLGVEPAEPNIMRRPPRNPQSGVLSKLHLFIVLIQGLIISAFTISVYAWSHTNLITSDPTLKDKFLKSPSKSDDPSAYEKLAELRSEAAILIMALQLTLSLLSRSVTLSVFTTGITENKVLFFSYVASFVIIAGVCYIPVLNEVLDFVPLSGFSWLKIFVCIFLLVFSSETTKLVIRKYFVNK